MIPLVFDSEANSEQVEEMQLEINKMKLEALGFTFDVSENEWKREVIPNVLDECIDNTGYDPKPWSWYLFQKDERDEDCYETFSFRTLDEVLAHMSNYTYPKLKTYVISFNSIDDYNESDVFDGLAGIGIISNFSFITS